jgi:hypothetical protein
VLEHKKPYGHITTKRLVENFFCPEFFILVIGHQILVLRIKGLGEHNCKSFE